MQDSTTLIITISIGIILFFILRGVNLWYWRINDLIKNQEENNNLLEKILTFQIRIKKIQLKLINY